MSARILVIDDNPSVLELEAIRLRRLGYDAVAYADPTSALAEATADPGRYDLVLTDFRMPDLSGLGLAARLRDEGQGLPILLMSGYRAEFTETELHEAGIDEVLEKPVGTEELAGAIDRLL